MGISNFTKVFTPLVAETTLEKQVSNKRIVVDGFSEIYRAFLGMGNIAGLTNKVGESTQHINIILHNTVKMMVSGATSIVWVFDTKACALKDREQEKRAECKENGLLEHDELEKKINTIKDTASSLNKDEIKELFGDYGEYVKELTDKLTRLKTRTIKGIGGKMMEDVKFMLDCLGIKYISAPEGIEGEQLAGQLFKDNLVDLFISNDTDSLLFGNTCVLKKIPKKSGKYDLYSLQNILTQHNGLTMDQLINIGVALGCDFADKVVNIGPKSVIKKIKNVDNPIVFNEDQHKAIEYFNKQVKIPKPSNPDSKITKDSIAKLTKWLVEEQSFKLDRMTKLLDPITPK